MHQFHETENHIMAGSTPHRGDSLADLVDRAGVCKQSTVNWHEKKFLLFLIFLPIAIVLLIMALIQVIIYMEDYIDLPAKHG